MSCRRQTACECGHLSPTFVARYCSFYVAQAATPSAEHHPEEWGPSDARRLTCSCGNRDPNHMAVTSAVDDVGGADGS
jgi:hypothetical protein